jgi:hypothetical protein
MSRLGSRALQKIWHGQVWQFEASQQAICLQKIVTIYTICKNMSLQATYIILTNWHGRNVCVAI